MHNYLLSEFLDAKGQTSDDYHSDAACKNVISHPSYVQYETKKDGTPPEKEFLQGQFQVLLMSC